MWRGQGGAKEEGRLQWAWKAVSAFSRREKWPGQCMGQGSGGTVLTVHLGPTGWPAGSSWKVWGIGSLGGAGSVALTPPTPGMTGKDMYVPPATLGRREQGGCGELL